MTFPTAPGAPQELAAVFVNVVPSLAGSQGLLREAYALGQQYASTLERSVGDAMRPAMARIGAVMSEGLSAGIGASAGQHILSHLLPTESAVTQHMGRLGRSSAGAYTREFEAQYKNMVPVFEDVSAKAVAANKAFVETTRAMGGQMSSFWYSSSKEATQAGDEMMAAWSTKMKIGVGIAAAAAGFEFVRNVKKEFQAFEHVGEEAASTLVGGFQSVMAGKMPDLIQPFNVLESAAKTSLEAPLQVAETFVPALGLVRRAVDGLFGPFDRLKDAVAPVMETMLDVGNEYLQLERTLAGSTLEPEKIAGLSNAVREIMASGAVVHFEDVADSIGRLSQNIKGLSTEQLKELSTTFAMAEELVGHIDETKFAGIINAWKIPAEQAHETLTMLTNTARATGIDINMLTTEMTTSGPAFRDLGYNAQQTAAFFGEMAAEGEKGQRLVLAMNELDKKLNELVEQGTFSNVKEAWKALTESAMEYEKAGKHAAALDLLNQYISPRVSPMLLEMLANGKVSAEQLGDAIEGVNSDIAESVEKSKDLGQTFEVIKQQISAALSPVGRELAAGLREGGNHVTEWLKENQGRVAQWAADIAIDFLNVGTYVTVMFANILHTMSPVFEAMKVAVLGITLPLGELAKAMGAVFGGGWDQLAGAIDKVNSGMLHTDIGKVLGEFDARANLFMNHTLPQWDAAIQAPVDNLKREEEWKKRGFKLWFDDDDPTKVKVKPQTKDGADVHDSGDLVPPGEVTLTFTPGFDQPKWHGQAPPTGFAYGGEVPWLPGSIPSQDSVFAALTPNEHVWTSDEVDAAGGHGVMFRLRQMAKQGLLSGFDNGGEVSPGLRVLYSFLRGVAGGFGLHLPERKDYQDSSGMWLATSGLAPGGTGLPAMYPALPAGGGVPLIQHADGTWGSPDPAWDHLIKRESSGVNQRQKIHDVNSGGNEAEGLFQITPATWRGHGGTEFAPTPMQATPQQQAVVAARILRANPSGSDWGAGLAGRENAKALLAALGGVGYEGGGKVGGSWFGSTVHEHPGPNTESINKHFAKFSGGGCAECGGPHPTAFHHGGITGFSQGGDVGEAFSQVIWSNKETGQDIGENAGKWVGTPGSADPGFYHRGHNDFADHTGHVHTTVLRDPYTGAPYNQIPAGTNITAGSSGFPDWVYKLGRMYHVKPSTYPGHQEWAGVNHGIDWWPDDATPNMTGQGYSHQDFATLTGFATAVGSMSAGQSQGAPAGAGFAGGTPGWQGYGVPIGAGADLPGGPFPTDSGSGGGGSPFSGGSFPPGSPIGPQGLIGPGYNPWTNPPPGLSPQKRDEYTHRYEEWQLEEDRRRRRHSEAQDSLTEAIQEQADAYREWKALDDKWKGETAEQQKLDAETAKKLQSATEKLSTANGKLERARDTATQDQLEDQVGHPPPQPGKEGHEKAGGPFESMSEQLGQGLVSGVFQGLGFPDVFGKPFTQWGLWKLLMGGLGFGINVGNFWADRAMNGDGGPLAGLAPGGIGFPGSLPGQVGGPLGTPPGPPSDNTPAAAPLGTPDRPLTVQGAPNKPPEPTQQHDPSKPGYNGPPIPGVTGPKTPTKPWWPNDLFKPPRPEPGQPGGGPPLGIPGGGQGAPFGMPGLSESLFNGTDYYEQSANTPSPFGFGSDGAAAGGIGGNYMRQFVDKAPAFLVGLQDENFRNKLLGGGKAPTFEDPNSPKNLVREFAPAQPRTTQNVTGGATNYVVHNNGVMNPDQVTRTVQKVVDHHYRWKTGQNAMFRTGAMMA